MEDTIITFETAKLAKEKWFPQEPNRRKIPYYNYKGEFNGDVKDWHRKYLRNEDTSDVESVSAPTQSLLAKWLREEYNIHVTSQIGNLDFINTYHYEIRYIDKNKFMCKVNGNFKTYEEALEIGLQKALKLINIIK